MKRLPTIVLLTISLLVICNLREVHAQDPLRFKMEVDSIVARNRDVNTSNLILFTGSSSIRLWTNLKSAFPNHNVVNMGFGGSEMTDLLYYVHDLILPFKPKQIFIYEGDNDISQGRTTEQILSAADSILVLVRKELPQTEVVFIAAKPSLRRWSLKEKYEAYNRNLKAWTASKKNVRYADVWTPMINSDGNVKPDIFVEDGLHLNDKGYAIWTSALRKFIKKM
jgi:lysophospholipase L1-like esterase